MELSFTQINTSKTKMIIFLSPQTRLPLINEITITNLKVTQGKNIKARPSFPQPHSHMLIHLLQYL